MRKMMLLAVFVMLGAATAFGYTFPEAFVYDGLITYDHGGMPVVPNSLHFNVGAGYLMASEAWDMNPTTKDFELMDRHADYTLIAVPIDVGYAINDRILADITLQVLSASNKPETGYGEEASATGLGDIWVKGRYLAPVSAMNLGGRLGIKIPVGKVEYVAPPEVADLPLGDDQMDIDVALVAAMYPEAGFAMNGQVGFRYRMAGTVTEYSVNPVNPYQYVATDVDVTPGMLIYFHVEPGYSMGTEKAFQFYVPIGYETTMANKEDDKTVDDSETNGLYLGLAPKYALDANNTLGLKFLYPIMGKNVYKSMLIGLTYEGYIPM